MAIPPEDLGPLDDVKYARMFTKGLPPLDTFQMESRDWRRVIRTIDNITVPGTWWVDILIGAISSAAIAFLVAALIQSKSKGLLFTLFGTSIVLLIIFIFFRLTIKRSVEYSMGHLRDCTQEIEEHYRPSEVRGSHADNDKEMKVKYRIC